MAKRGGSSGGGIGVLEPVFRMSMAAIFILVFLGTLGTMFENNTVISAFIDLFVTAFESIPTWIQLIILGALGGMAYLYFMSAFGSKK